MNKLFCTLIGGQTISAKCSYENQKLILMPLNTFEVKISLQVLVKLNNFGHPTDYMAVGWSENPGGLVSTRPSDNVVGIICPPGWDMVS